MHTLDHLVYAVPDLSVALDWFAEHAGLRPAIGGRHLHQGTHNAVVNLGQGAYLEIVAPDPENTTIPPPRWMGVDLVRQPQMVRWSLKNNDLPRQATLLRTINPELGSIHTGQRQLTTGELLRWQMTLPLAQPAVDLIPFFLDWSSSDFHPTDRMPEEFSLVSLNLEHPEPQAMEPSLASLGVQQAVSLAAQPSIIVRLQTPKGELVLR